MDGKGRPSTKIKVTKRIVVQSDTQTWVEVTSNRDGLILFDPDLKRFTKTMCLVAAGVPNVAGDKRFKILVANFASTLVELSPRKAQPLRTLRP